MGQISLKYCSEQVDQGDRFGNMMERPGIFIEVDYMDHEEDELFLHYQEGKLCN